MAQSLKSILGDGYEQAGVFPNEVRVSPSRARELLAEGPYEALYGAKKRPKFQSTATVRKPPLYKLAKLADHQIPGDIRSMGERLEDFIKRASVAKNFFLETLCASLIYGMGIPKDECNVVHRPNHVAPMGTTREDVTWIESKTGDFHRYNRLWLDCPPSSTDRGVSCNAAIVTQEWRQLMAHPERKPDQTDHVLLVLAFIRVLNCLPTQVELVTQTDHDGMRVKWQFRRRDYAGPRP